MQVIRQGEDGSTHAADIETHNRGHRNQLLKKRVNQPRTLLHAFIRILESWNNQKLFLHGFINLQLVLLIVFPFRLWKIELQIEGTPLWHH